MNSANTPQQTSVNSTERHSRQEIRQMLLRRRVRRTRPIYWRKLVEVGVPIHAADVISKAIAQYDAVRQVPSSSQQHLINEYCRFICRADLWRSQLLISQVS
ncbi:MAG: hypothetical protein F6K65_40410 [Moorea sp. SIO3C2]|nr:hypothetical protein [Moorena sp. SIO3C2]